MTARLGFRFFPLIVFLALPLATAAAPVNLAPMVVHEWGTFTSLQDEAGQAIGGINTDDEPVPKFVHRLAGFLLLSPTQVPGIFFQGAPSCHPDVTMRLETPVLYFHPPKSQPTAHNISVTARFRGGWLSEYYPDAEAKSPGVEANTRNFGPLRAGTVGSLDWKNLEVGGDWAGPPTAQHVWTSPRAVDAAPLRTATGEKEKFLFYRGVGHIDAPITVAQNADAKVLTLRSHCPSEIAHQDLKVRSLWLVNISDNGEVAFRAIPAVALNGEGEILATISKRFAPADFSLANRERLKKSLRIALVREGLFDDEAQALLNTWELSYFKSAGLRLFFMVPRAWTDFYLPVTVSAPAEITRVMVGRIELVTPEQRNYLRQIGQLKPKVITAERGRLHADFYHHLVQNPDDQRVNSGEESLAAFGVSVPKSYQLYLALGRFRNALILDEAKKRPTPGLDSLISAYNLQGYQPLPATAANGG